MNDIINATFSNIEQFERFDRYTTLRSLYTALYRQVEDGLMGQQECDRTRFIVRKSWDLKLQIHLLEMGCTQVADVIAHIISLMLDLYLEDVIPKCLFVCAHSCMMHRLVAKGIISFSMRRKRRGAVQPVTTGIISDCDVCGGFMLNAQRYMHMNDAYFTPRQIRFPYEMKNVFERIVHEQQYPNTDHPHHIALDLDQLDRIFEYRFVQSRSYSFPVTSVELEYMFDTLGFLWLHHGSPQYVIYLLEKLVDGLASERRKPARRSTITTTL